MTIGQKLKILRERISCTQAEVATTLNIEQSTLANYEMDKRNPKTEILVKIADLYNTTTDYLLGRTDETGTGKIPESFLDVMFSSDKVGNIISKTIFTKLGYGVDEAALFFKISLSELQDILKGTEWPPYEFIIMVAEKCEVSTDYLLGITQNPRKADMDGIYPFRTNEAFRSRIKNLLSRNGMPDSFYPDFLGITEAEFYMMREYGLVPHLSVITKLASMLNSSCDYILGTCDEQTEKLVKAFKQLNIDNQDIILGELKKCLKEQVSTSSVAAEDIPLQKASGK